jgi:Uma2 family endonuclease
MGYAARKPAMGPDAYLAWEAGQPTRSEFVDGEVFAMAGAEERHVTVAGNAYMALRQALAGTPCRTFLTDMKLRPLGADDFFYPDVFVTCAEADRALAQFKREPCLIIEVLSPTTAAYDRGEKFARYRRIASVREVVIVDIDTRRIDVYRRRADGLFVLHAFEPGEDVVLASVGVTLTATVLFAEVPDAPPATPAWTGPVPEVRMPPGYWDPAQQAVGR